VSSFDKDEVYIYDLKRMLDLTLPNKKLSSQAINLLAVHHYSDDWITTIPKIVKSMGKGLDLNKDNKVDDEFDDEYDANEFMPQSQAPAKKEVVETKKEPEANFDDYDVDSDEF
jgi:hypothetical protein